MFKQMDGIREGRCIDSDSGTTQPGGPMHIYPCVNRWFQFFAFGDGKIAPKGSIYTKIPSRVVQQISNLGHDWIPYMCYGVYGLGDADEETWNNEEEEEDEGEEDENYEDQWHRHDEGFAFDSSLPDTDKDDKVKDDPGKPQSILSAFNGHEVITTQCSNSGAVIEWLFVPFILEDPPEEKDGEEL